MVASSLPDRSQFKEISKEIRAQVIRVLAEADIELNRDIYDELAEE